MRLLRWIVAQRFNELAVSQGPSERIARLERFLAPQVAELVEGREQEALLDSHAPRSS
jgi:hypothetical protein